MSQTPYKRRVHPLLAPYTHCMRPHDWEHANKYTGASVRIGGYMSEGKYRDSPHVILDILGPSRSDHDDYYITSINTAQGVFRVKGDEITLPHPVTERLAEMLVGKSLDHLFDLPGCPAVITKIESAKVTFAVPEKMEPYIHTKGSWDTLHYNNRIEKVLDYRVPASLKPGLLAMSDKDLIKVFEDLTRVTYVWLELSYEDKPVTVSIQTRHMRSGKINPCAIEMTLGKDIKINHTGHISFPLVSDSIATGLVGMDGDKLIDHWAVRQSKIKSATSKKRKTVAYLTFEKASLREILGDRVTLVERRHNRHLNTM